MVKRNFLKSTGIHSKKHPTPLPKPITWGRTGVGTFTGTSAVQAYGSLWQCPVTGTVKKMTAYLQQFNSGDTSATVNVGIYVNNSGQAGALLGSGSAVCTLTSAITGYPISITSVNVVQGQFYILAFGTTGTTSGSINVNLSTSNPYDGSTKWSATSLVTNPASQSAVAGQIYCLTASITISKKYGFVATRGTFPSAAVSGQNYSNSRFFAYARDTLTKIQLLLPNFYGLSSVCGGSIIYTASIEYPAGTFQQFLFGGTASGSIPDGNVLYSDSLTLSAIIPAGSQFWIRIFQNASGTTSGVLTGVFSYASGGDCYQTSATSISDLTMSGTIPAADGNGIGMFLGIIGVTNKPSVLLQGESRVLGSRDSPDITGDAGQLGRAIGATFGYSNLGIRGGATMVDFVKGVYPKAAVLSLASFATHVFIGGGDNDVFNGQTALQIESTIKQIWAMFPDPLIGQCTIINNTLSSDGWTTLGNQSASGNFVVSGTGPRETYNTFLRQLPSGVNFIFDIAAAGIVQAASNSYLWTPGYTNDGIHELAAADLAIKNSGIVKF